MQTIRIQVLFDEETLKGHFRDALYYEEAEWNAMTIAEREVRVIADKKTRTDSFVEALSYVLDIDSMTIAERADYDAYLVQQGEMKATMLG